MERERGPGGRGTRAAQCPGMNAIFFGLKRAFHGTLRIARPMLTSLGLTAARFDLPGNRPIVRLRRSGGGRFIQAGERAISDDETKDALQRQTNNCVLANLVDATLRRP